jgi:hypothetical protein
MSKTFKALLVGTGAVAIILISLERGALATLLAWVAPAQEAALALTQTYFFRLAIRPFSKRFTQVLVLVTCGEAIVGRFKSRYIVRTFKMIVESWSRLSLAWRIAIAGGVFSAISLSEYGSYLALVMLPFASPLLRLLHFWGLDIPVDHFLRPIRRKWRRALRKNPILRALRRPYRSVVCILLRRTETARQHKWWKSAAGRIGGTGGTARLV